MTTQQNIRLNKLSLGIFDRLTSLFNGRRSAKHRERRDYEQLAALPDYLLRDVGIKRSEINVKLGKPFWWS